MSCVKKRTRQIFRQECFARDENKCVMCETTYGLVVHHIIDRHLIENGGYQINNGITLCPTCHLKAEVFHQSEGQLWESGYHPDELQSKINTLKHY